MDTNIVAKTCRSCNRRIRPESKSELCHRCRSVCACGKPKDYRADECMSCGMSRKANAQWADPEKRQRIESGNREAQKLRRITLADLTEASFHPRPGDGRFFAHYWDGDRKRVVYRALPQKCPLPQKHTACLFNFYCSIVMIAVSWNLLFRKPLSPHCAGFKIASTDSRLIFQRYLSAQCGSAKDGPTRNWQN